VETASAGCASRRRSRWCRRYTQRSRARSQREIEWLYSLPERAELDGALYVHGSPLRTLTASRPSGAG
jgi:hypothetical protein